MRFESRSKPFRHETIATFLCEVGAIIKLHPVVSISTDPEMPAIISPSMLRRGKDAFLAFVSIFLNLSDINRAQ